MLTHTHWLKKIWEDMYLPFYLIPQELAVCSYNSWQHSLNCTVGASDRSSMPQGIVWFKILLCCKSQQMVVGFFEVDFYSSHTFKQLPPLLLTSSSMQLSGKKVWKWTKEGWLFFVCFAVSRERPQDLQFPFFGVLDMALCLYQNRSALLPRSGKRNKCASGFLGSYF